MLSRVYNGMGLICKGLGRGKAGGAGTYIVITIT